MSMATPNRFLARCRNVTLRGCWAPALLLAGLATPALPAQTASSKSAPLPTLTTARAVHELNVKLASSGYPVHLHGVVTIYDGEIDRRHVAIFVTDDTASIFVTPAIRPAVPLIPGQSVEVTGVTAAGDFAPIVSQATVRVTGRSHLPTNAPRATMGRLMTSAGDGQWQEIEGVVHSALESGNNEILDVVLQDGHVSALTTRQFGVDYQSLVDARVTIRGNEAPLFNHQGQMTGARLLFPSLEALHVEEAAPRDPFALPISPIHGLLRYTPDTTFQHRVRLHATVTLAWPGRLLCLRDGADGICAQTAQTTPLAPGDIVDVVGFPMIGAFTPTLDHATYRDSGLSQSVPATLIDADEALRGNRDSQPVQIEGLLLGEDRAADDPTLVFSSGNVIFAAVLPGRSLANAMPRLEAESRVRLTGICSVQSDTLGSNLGAGFTVGKSFRILLRSPDDVQIVQKPSWWNAEHTLRILALALAIAMLALLAAVVLSMRVRQQTRVIQAQLAETAALKDAAEAAHKAADFQATHDGLTGLLNRKAVLDGLHGEFELASRSGAQIGLIMLDLDHFKRINDTCGHMGGDKVLKESVRRILASVRSTDLVGRYGGEEFLIVLPDCEHDQLLSCAERIRLAISEEKIDADGLSLTATASEGATVANPRRHSENDALRIADRALYIAKDRGRDRVVFLDLDSTPPEDVLPGNPGPRIPDRKPLPIGNQTPR